MSTSGELRRALTTANDEKRKTAKQAAVEVLESTDEPLKSDEITRRVLAVKGVRLAGKTPAASVAALLAVESKKPDGLFVRTAPGIYTLRERGAS
ncbi:MAG TPA: HTH domain-containing protein [Solirubrobacteraceae bacterium]